MRRLPASVEEGILRRLLQGVDYRRIGCEFDVSIATVSRVFEDARKRIPDVDSLRGLSILLRKAGLSVFDATRACTLMEALKIWSISMDELGDYVRVNEEFLSERVLDEDFLLYAMKLMQLEHACGRTYREVVEDFERKRKEVAEAEQRKVALDNESLKLTADLKDAKENLEKMKLEIAQAVSVRKGLAEISLGKLAQLVEFIHDFEAMGFNAKVVGRLAVWRRELEKLNIDSDRLTNYIKERGPLEAQNDDLRLANEKIEAEIKTEANRMATLIASNSALQAMDRILATGTLTMLCKTCGYPMSIALPTRESLVDLMSAGLVQSCLCPNCKLHQQFTPWEFALQITWIILPTETLTI